MQWPFKLGRLLGIDVFVQFTFLIVLAIVGIARRSCSWRWRVRR
jgi:hypothetical protein